jgi:sorbitol/mannitol transport system permease protein
MRTRRSTPIQPSQVLRIVVAWAVTLLLFFPMGWLILTAFKTELQAIN